MTEHDCDLLIVGAGPAGLYAAYYAGFRGFSSVVMDALPEPGGQITAMYPEKEIFDVAGFPAIKGRALVEGLLDQAGQFEPTYLMGEQAVGLSTSSEGPVVVTGANGSTVTCKAVILASGIGAFKPRPIPVGSEWHGRGLVYFVPRLDEHAGKDIVIVGGGDSAFDWAWSLHPIAKSVTLVHRRDQFRAHTAMVEKVREADIRLITSAEVSDIHGGTSLAKVTITSKTNQSQEILPADTIVAALGFIANIGPMAEWGLELDKRRIVVDTSMRASLPRVFAAGDITTYPGKVALISVGFGEAATAVNNAAPLIDPDSGVFPGHSSGASAD